jgi:predicted RecB family nuclease
MKTKAIINKKQFLDTLFCPTLGWQLKHGPLEDPQSPSEQLRIDQGLEIHNRARSLFPEGVMVSSDNISSAQKTQQLLSNPATTVIFEATFIWESFIAKADILIKNGAKWRLIEVKSDANDDKKLVDDLYYIRSSKFHATHLNLFSSPRK